MQRRITAAERRFLDTLSEGVTKVAVDLQPATRDLLGLSQESPDDLDHLEASAATPSPGPPPSRAHAVPAAPMVPPPVDDGAGIAVDPEEASSSEAGVAPPAVSQDLAPQPSPVDDDPDADEDDPPPEGPPVPTRATHGKTFNARRTHPMHLHATLTAKYGTDWIFWEAETLWWAIRKDFGPVGDLTRNKIQALRTATVSYVPWDDWDTFENCSLAWNDTIPIFNAYQPMPPSQMAFGITVMRELHPEAPWGHEVCAYQGMILEDNGFVYAPEEWFPGAQPLLDRRVEMVGLRSDVSRAWEKLRGQDLSAVNWRHDNPVDIHIAKLLVIQLYLAEREAMRAGAPESAPAATPTTTSPPVP